MENIKAVIFDLYGTLIYLADGKKLYRKISSDIGLKTPEELRKAHKIAVINNFDNLSEFVEELVKEIKPNADIKNINIKSYEKELKKEISSAELYPEVKRVLDELKKRNFKLGLISNLASPYKEPFFNLELDKYFDEVFFSCNIGMRKSNLRIYKEILKYLKTTPEESLMTGDNIYKDVKVPKSIGINAIHLDRKNVSVNSLSSLDEIFHYL